MHRSIVDKLVGALLLCLPIATVAVVGYALVVVGAERPLVGARIYGGPTEGVAALSWRLAVIRSDHGFTDALSLERVDVVAHLGGGRDARWSGPLDAEGMAAVTLALPAPASGPIDVEVGAPGFREPLARGKLALSRRDWLAREKRLGGWISAHPTGKLRISVAPGRGAFTVPFADPLWIDVRDAAGPVAGASIAFKPDSVTLDPATGARTDARGRAVVSLTPHDFHVALRVIASTDDGRHGEWYASVPVVVGAMDARFDGAAMRILSAIERPRAYYAVLTASARLAGGPVELHPDGHGGSTGTVSLPPLPPGPAWAQISGDADLASLGTVGWPIRPGDDAPPHARVVPDRLLLDGIVAAAARDHARHRRAQLLAGLFSIGALGLLGVMLTVRVRRASAQLDAGLREAGQSPEQSEQLAPRAVGFAIVIAVACIAIGFLVVALIAIFKMS